VCLNSIKPDTVKKMGRNMEVNSFSIRCSYIFTANDSDRYLDRCNTRKGGMYKEDNVDENISV